jgi:hypothetical protein
MARKLMDRGKLIAILTGVISIVLALAYLLLVQLLDLRGEMIPAPVSYLPQGIEIASGRVIQMFLLIPQILTKAVVLPPG